MPGKVLIVDDIATNRIVLQVKLSTAGYTVLAATSGVEALQVAFDEQPDLLLCSERLNDMSAKTLIESLQADPRLAKVSPVVLCASIEQRQRLELISAGAVDVLIKSPALKALLARFRAVLRNSQSHEDTLLHQQMEQVLGFAETTKRFQKAVSVCLVSDSQLTTNSWLSQLESLSDFTFKSCSLDDATKTFDATRAPDVIVIDALSKDADKALNLLAELNAGSLTRHSKIIAILQAQDSELLSEILDRGADDILAYGFCAKELALRLGRQAQAKRRDDKHRENMHEGLRAAATDALTGLYNRRVALLHLAQVAGHCSREETSCAVMVVDVDHFKSINDKYGHEAGDVALVNLAKLLKQSLRAGDMASRIGGEEFMLVLPATSAQDAKNSARRLCKLVANHRFKLPGTLKPVQLTVSIGVAVIEPQQCFSHGKSDKIAQDLLREADLALYGSKSHGRNQVTLSPQTAA